MSADMAVRPPAPASQPALEGFGERGRRLAAQTLGTDWSSRCARLGMLLLTPDALVSQAVPRTLTWLAEQGLRVCYAVALDATPEQMRLLYWEAASHRDPDMAAMWRAMDPLWRSHPSVALIVAAVAGPADAADLSAWLRGRKGHADTRERLPGSLRAVLDTENLLLSFVHTPDTTQAFLRELVLLLGPRAGTALRASAAPDAVRELIPPPSEIVPAVAGRDAVSVPATLYRVGSRLLQDALVDLPARQVDEPVRECAAGWLAAAGRLRRAGRTGAYAELGRVAGLLRTRAAGLPAGGFAAAIDLLCRVCLLPGGTARQAEHLLADVAGSGVYVSHWERVVVGTSVVGRRI